MALTVSLAYSGGLLSRPVTTISPLNIVSFSNSGLGLRLDLWSDSTHLGVGDRIGITIRESNTRFVTNRVQTGPGWRIRGLSLGECVNSPIGFAIFQGNYTEDTISAASPLQLYEPIFECPALYYVSSYRFAPASDFVEVVGNCISNPCPRMNMEGIGLFAGWWNYSITPAYIPPSFQQFSAGAYTVAGGDEWGDLLILHFTVN